jgi:hypothetical protein
MNRRAKGLFQKDEAVLDCRQLGGTPNAACRTRAADRAMDRRGSPSLPNGKGAMRPHCGIGRKQSNHGWPAVFQP